MINAVERMKSVGRREQDAGAPTSIFGSAAGLAQSIESEEQFRISIYPVICERSPEIAMGLASCLAYLLEQYRDAKVYRCFARFDANDDNSEISDSDYQFEIADWELTGLADNVVLSGRLEVGSSGCDLDLVLDSGLLDEREPEQYTTHHDSLAETVQELPRVAAQLMGVLGWPKLRTGDHRIRDRRSGCAGIGELAGICFLLESGCLFELLGCRMARGGPTGAISRCRQPWQNPRKRIRCLVPGHDDGTSHAGRSDGIRRSAGAGNS